MLHACIVQGWCGPYLLRISTTSTHAVRTVRWCKYPVLPLTKKTSYQRGHRRRGQTAPLRGSAVALRAREDEAAFSFLNRYSYTGVSAMTVQF